MSPSIALESPAQAGVVAVSAVCSTSGVNMDPMPRTPAPPLRCSSESSPRQMPRSTFTQLLNVIRRTEGLMASRHNISNCANLAPAGTGTISLTVNLGLYSKSAAAHKHERGAPELAREGIKCFVMTLRDPAARLERLTSRSRSNVNSSRKPRYRKKSTSQGCSDA